MDDLDDLFSRVERLIRHHGSGSEWFAKALLSWSGLDEIREVNLNEVWRLDPNNLELLIRLLRLPLYTLDESDRSRLHRIVEITKECRAI